MLDTNKLSLRPILALTEVVAKRFKTVGSCFTKSEQHPKSQKLSSVFDRKKSLLIVCIAFVVTVVGFSCLVRRSKESDSGTIKSPPSLSRSQPASSTGPLTVRFGFLPKRIYELDPSKGFFKADFYVWMKYDKSLPVEYLRTTDFEKTAPPIEYLEADNGGTMEMERQYYTTDDKPEHRVWYRVRAPFYHNFDMHNYPFDEQTLVLALENPLYPAANLRYVIDDASGYSSQGSDGSSADLDPGLLSLIGWKTERIQHIVRINHYPTDWGLAGEPELKEYSQSVLIITLKRRAGQHLAEIIFPLLAAAFLATLVFFHSNKDLSAAIWICVAMFISVVGHHRGLLTAMPDVKYFITSDFFFLLTYMYIVMCLMIVLIADYYSRKGCDQTAKRVCSRSRVILPISYLVLMLVVASPAFK